MGVIQVYFRYQGSVCSDLDDTKVFIQNILNRLENVVDDENLLFDLKLILNELIINSVIHGNKCKKEKCVHLYLEILGDTIRIEVSDEGRGIDFDLSSYNPKELKCCGRGLILVDGLSDELYIDENRVEVIKYIC